MEEYSKSCKNVDSDRVMLKVRKKCGRNMENGRISKVMEEYK
jgi:hypothetical protein